MTEPITVRVLDIVGSNICVSADDGQRLHDKIKPLLDKDYKIILSFQGVDTLISTFLNAAIGQLYGTLSEEKIRENFSVAGMEPDDLDILKRVVENAKAYFSRPRQYDQAWKEEVGDEE
jgi:hypothetical protein